MPLAFEIRFDTARMSDDRVEELCDWIRSLGLVPDHFRSSGVIFKAGDGYDLHLSEVIHAGDGHPMIDYALNETVTRPHVISIGAEPSWPEWLNEAAVGV